MKLYRSTRGIFVTQDDGRTFFKVDATDWDDLLRSDDLHARVQSSLQGAPVAAPQPNELLPPVGTQEVWAAGVTYFRSRSARMEESKDAGGGTFYDRVYSATRPELFFKASGWRVVGSGSNVRIRSDATWSVPEPELTLVLNPRGEIVGYTIGNDMSSRDIEGENPLYLPQAKVYDGSCAVGPCVLLSKDLLPKTTAIRIQILRGGTPAFEGTTSLAELKRDPRELASYLFRESSFPQGALLMTGTGIVPGDEFTLASGDVIRITIDGIGTLENPVA
ncbi:MAG TPA: fumarylacetoacetate hydrolase family protein [Acidobacteriaceae bacterium]|jgi:2-dehydro-3-deoxy-D-arabinonate dehydratase|nr:fumarylacetoacetate hydrolase family protein [Acidobacteriaceae bacterium]